MSKSIIILTSLLLLIGLSLIDARSPWQKRVLGTKPNPDNPPVLECKTLPSTPGDRRKNKDELTVVSWNAGALFFSANTDCPGAKCEWDSLEEVQTHFESIAAILKNIDADIVHLTELQDCHSLELLRDMIPNSQYVPYLIGGDDKNFRFNVGLLTKIDPVSLTRKYKMGTWPISNTTCRGAKRLKKSDKKDYTQSLERNLIATFNVEGLDKPLSLIGIQLTPLPIEPNDFCMRREVEASIVANMTRKAAKNGNHVIVAGDFNDFDIDVPGADGRRPSSNTLHLIKHSLKGKELYNPAQVIEKKKRFTFWDDDNRNCVVEHDEKTMTDYMLLSPSLKGKVSDFKIGNDFYEVSCSDFYSNHFPLITKFKLGDTTKSEQPMINEINQEIM